MRLFKISYLFLIAISVAAISYAWQDDDKISYWIWGWDDLSYISSNSPLYIYQGDYYLPGQSKYFVNRGIDVTDEVKGHNVTLLLRVYSIENPEVMIEIIEALVSRWEYKDVSVLGIQLDYDAPSSKLNEYTLFLDELSQFTRKNNIELSITGLVTWLLDNYSGTIDLSTHVEYIAYQLYSKYHPLDNVEKYFSSLYSIGYPYKIGITTSPKFNNIGIPNNEFYKGKIVFLNK